jgi:hypothetical protein
MNKKIVWSVVEVPTQYAKIFKRKNELVVAQFDTKQQATLFTEVNNIDAYHDEMIECFAIKPSYKD